MLKRKICTYVEIKNIKYVLMLKNNKILPSHTGNVFTDNVEFEVYDCTNFDLAEVSVL